MTSLHRVSDFLAWVDPAIKNLLVREHPVGHVHVDQGCPLHPADVALDQVIVHSVRLLDLLNQSEASHTPVDKVVDDSNDVHNRNAWAIHQSHK